MERTRNTWSKALAFTRNAKGKVVALISTTAIIIPWLQVHAGRALENLQDIGAAAEIDTGTSVETTIADIIRSLLAMLGIVLVILIIYGGFLWMTAGGNEEQVSKAKKILRNAVIGIVIIFLSALITEFVLERLPGA